jgi:hypothetical protein
MLCGTIHGDALVLCGCVGEKYTGYRPGKGFWSLSKTSNTRREACECVSEQKGRKEDDGKRCGGSGGIGGGEMRGEWIEGVLCKSSRLWCDATVKHTPLARSLEWFVVHKG